MSSRYREVLAQLEYQAGQAEVWRDAVTELVPAHFRHRRRTRPRGPLPRPFRS